MIHNTLPMNFSTKLPNISARQLNYINICCQKMDNIISNNVMSIPIISPRGLLLSKPYTPHYFLSTSKTNATERKDGFAVSVKNHASLGPKLIEIVKHKLIIGAKILPLGRAGKIFRKNFSTGDCEKLLHATRCSIYTTAGAIAGILFISTERVGFRSDKSLKAYSTTGELLKFQYKVSIPLRKIKRVAESRNMKRPSNKYVELVTVDDFSFWFMGFPSYTKTLRYLCQTISPNC